MSLRRTTDATATVVYPISGDHPAALTSELRSRIIRSMNPPVDKLTQPKPKPAKRARKGAKKRPTGRPSKYSAAIVKRIINGLSKGTPLTVICAPANMPSDMTVREWMRNRPDLSEAIARAREAGFDRIALDALAIADTPLEGQTITDKPDGREIRRGDMLGHRRLQVETRLKLLAKWDPKRYGEMTRQEISGPEGGPIQTATRERTADEQAQFARLLADADRKARPAPP